MEEITLKDIIKEFRKYKGAHPLKLMSLVAYDENGEIIMNDFTQNIHVINSINAIGRPLQLLSRISRKAYDDMVKVKLAAVHGNTYDLHNLISALCELSVMNTFICRSSAPESFIYEDQVNPVSKKNVEFSIQMAEYIFHVEVKTSNLVLEDQKIAQILEKNPEVVITDARIDNYEEFQKSVSSPVRGSLDRRLVDYLKSANEKFVRSSNSNEINLLIICWDDRIQQALMALKGKKYKGILTSDSFEKDDNGDALQYPNVDCVLVNTTYNFFKGYVAMLLFQEFSLEYPVDPFFQVFSSNFLIDYNLTEDRIQMIESILQTKVQIVDETYADNLNPISVATMKEGEKNVICFNKFGTTPNDNRF